MQKISLEEAREAAGLTREQLAEEAGISESTIQRIETGSIHMTKDETAQCIADALGMRIDEIEWPNGLTNQGRRPRSLTEEVTETTFSFTVHTVTRRRRICSKCHTEVAINGECLCYTQ